jgi:ketosteroid isomerase-like protein
MRYRALLILASAAILAGCGGGGENDQQSAHEVAQSYVDAYNSGDFAQVCDLLSESYRQQLKIGANCPAFFKEQTSGEATTLTLIDVQEKGDLATAHIRSGTANETAAFVRDQGGDWRLATVTSFSAK